MSDPAACVMHGVELDAVSAAIGNHLIPTGSRIDVGNLTGVTLPHRGPGADGYDLVVGNVPFAAYVPHAADNPDRLSLHNYALVKGARMTRPGGYLAVLTSRYTLDATSSTTRDQLAPLTNLVAAVRLPTDAHAERAGTAVVTDILICHRPTEPTNLTGWPRPVPVDVDGITVNVNGHFRAHPDRVLGKFAVGGMRHEDDLRVLHPDARSGGYLDTLRTTLERIAEDAPHLDPAGLAPAVADRRMSVDSPLPLGSIVTSGSRFQRLTSTGAADHKVPATQRAEFNALCQLRDLVRAVLDADATGHPDADQHRTDLNRTYDRYVTRWGPLNRFDSRPLERDTAVDDSDGSVGGKRIYPRMGGFRSDPGWWSVAALEHFDDDTQTATNAPLLYGPVARTATYPDHVDDPATAVRVLLARDGDITPDAVAALAGVAIDQVKGWLGDEVFRDPARHGALAPAAIYLTGLVRDKLDEGRAAADQDPTYRRNVDALEAVQPAWLSSHDITPRIGATWIPADDLRQFLVDEIGLPHATVVHVPELASWTLTAGGYSADNEYTYAVNHRRTAVELIEDLANQKATRITVEIEGRRVVDVDATAAASAKRSELEDLFANWVWSDPERTERLVAVYNHTFNNYVEPRWDGSHIQPDGLGAGFIPRAHQLDAVARILGDRDRGTLLAHAVGAGKTAVMAIAAVELRRLGIAGGPVGIVVPNSMLAQFAREFLQLYPTANILVADDTNFARDRRREFVARAASGAYDVVLFTHTSFTAVPPSPETITVSIDRELDAYRQALNTVEATTTGAAKGKAVKQIENAIASLESRLEKLVDRAHYDDGSVTFEQLGLGHLMVDEAHLAKNLSFPTRIDTVQVRESARARDLLVKCDWLREHRGPGAVTFATATPVTNQISEMWVFQRFLDLDGLQRAGIEQFDAWAANYATTVTAVEITPSGSGFRTVSRFARFTNVPELAHAFRAFADVRTAEQLNLPRPEIAGGQPTTITVPADDRLRAFMAHLVERSHQVKNSRRAEPGDDNVLAIASDGRVGALDLRLANRSAGYGHLDGPSPKVAAAADKVAARYHASVERVFLDDHGKPHPTPGATQIVFCDHGVPGNPHHDVYADLTDALVERGIPRERIAAVQTAGNHAERAQLFAAVRDGRIAVLVGSTYSMGVGVNVQTRLVASHILTPPWRPDEVEQAEGRILRQGNQNPTVELLRYVAEGSYDGYSWQTIERKARFIGQIMTAPDALGRQLVDEDAVADEYAILKAIATGDPRILTAAQLESQVTALERARRVHDRGQKRIGNHIDQLTTGIDHTRRALRALDQHLTGHNAEMPTLLHDERNTTTLTPGETGNTERLGQHILNAARRHHYGRPPQIIAHLSAVPFQFHLEGTHFHVAPAGVDHLDIRRSWERGALFSHSTNPIGIGQAVINLARSLPEQHQRLGQYIDQQQQRLDDLTAKADTPFAHSDELNSKRRDLAALHAELTAITEPDPAPEPTPAEQPQPIRPTRSVGIDL